MTTIVTPNVDVPASTVTGHFVDALAQRDFGAVAAILADDVWMRATLIRDPSDPGWTGHRRHCASGPPTPWTSRSTSRSIENPR